MNNDLLAKMLDLPEFQIDDLKHNEHDIQIYVSKHTPPNVCTQCGVFNPRLRVHQHRYQQVRDLSIMNKLVALNIKRTKYKCLECGAVFYQPLDCVPEKGKMTHRLRDYIASQSKKRNFTDIERELSISNVTIRKIFLDEIHKLPNHYDFETPEVVSIDEIFIEREGKSRKQPWCVIFNQTEKTIIDMLPNRNRSTVIEFFKSFKNPENVKVVTSDMWETYKIATYEAFPNAVVIVDRFHVIKLLTKCFEDYRKSFKSKLSPKRAKSLKKDRYLLLTRPNKLSFTSKIFKEAILAEFPELRVAYDLKEQFHQIYEAQTREEAEKLYFDWLESIPEDLHIYDPLITAVTNWNYEIFNYFNHGRYTNAIAEGFNRLIRQKAYEGVGYDFEVFRAKVIYGINHKIERPKYGEHDFNLAIYSNYRFKIAPEDFKDIDYGVPLLDAIKFAIEGKI